MPDQSLEDMIAEKIEARILGRLTGFVEKLEEAAASLREALGEGGGSSKGKVKGKRGRPVGSGKKAGAKPGPKKKGTRTRIKSEDWQEAIRSILKAKGPLKRPKLRDEILKLPAFKDKNAAGVYNGIPTQAKKMKDVAVSEDGTYELKSASASKGKKEK